MAKIEIKPNPKVRAILDDLEKYRNFCVDFGYKFDEAHLYDMRVFSYRQHAKQLAGKNPKDQWAEDMR